MKQRYSLHKLLIALIIFLIPNLSFSAIKITIPQVLADCKAMGNKVPDQSVSSELKQQTSLIGMAYLNYIYQNDIKNEHFCQSMLLMNSQVPAGIGNPYIHLFDAEMAGKTMPILEDIQLSFDYAIARTNPPLEKVQASVNSIQTIIKNVSNS